MTSTLLARVDAGDFTGLFLEELGWNAPTVSPLSVTTAEGNTYSLTQVASFRGMGVWHCTSIPTTSEQRQIDAKVASKNTERLIIYSVADRQEWRWPRYGRNQRSGRPSLVSHRHRVGESNPGLTDRLQLIAIPFGSSITVPELLTRMREAFDVEAEAASAQAARLMGTIFERLDAAGMSDEHSSVFLARALFLMFGDDTDMWRSNVFFRYLTECTNPDGSDLEARLEDVFAAANTPEKLRSKDLNPVLRDLPYINGGIFAEDLVLPSKSGAELRAALIDAAKFDWGQISPAVFGSMFQTVKSKEARRAFGEHYTTEKNILKVLEPLFLDELNSALDKAWDDPKALTKLHNRLGMMTYLDPACGCGNFLIVAYRELRALELEILKRLRDLEAESGGHKRSQLQVDATLTLKVTVEQFYGIEVEPWPARIAETAMFLVDHQANLKMESELGEAPRRLPIDLAPHIHLGSALTQPWDRLLSIDADTMIFGNPPFVGSLLMTDEQKNDARFVWGNFKRFGTMDFVTNWFVIAARNIREHGCRAAFVSTNSITQGEQVGALWGELDRSGVDIPFAHQAFAWDNEAPDQAGVHVVILGLAGTVQGKRRLFTYSTHRSNPVEHQAEQINAYLVEGPKQVIGTRLLPLNRGQTQMRFGSMPRDGGWLSKIDATAAQEIRASDPVAAKYLRRLIGSEELINGQERWCLWLTEASPVELVTSRVLAERIRKVREMRESSKAASTRSWANRPEQFVQQAQPTTPYIAVPGVSSESRPYVPMAIFEPSVKASNALLTISNADYYTLGLLMSRPFNAWARTVSGRLESRIRLSAEITYHNFPYPPVSEEEHSAIERAMEGVLLSREEHEGKTLADLYGPQSMPANLRTAHRTLDEAVLGAYGLTVSSGADRILSTLFARYHYLVDEGTLQAGSRRNLRR